METYRVLLDGEKRRTFPKVNRPVVVQPKDPSIKFIPLTQGQNAIVDAVDFEWLSQWNWQAKWSKGTQSFYAARSSSAKNRSIWMHAHILGYPKEKIVDHKNHNTLDNRRDNLRLADYSESSANRRILSKRGHKGVRPSWNKWRAQIKWRGKVYSLGQFDTPEQAYEAYKAKARELHGEFACG